MFSIRTFDKIAPKGLEVFNGWRVGPQVEAPDGIILRSTKLDLASFMPTVLGIARAGAGVDNIDVRAATQAGIAVFNTPGANARSVAELVLALLLYHARKLGEAIQFTRNLVRTTEDYQRAAFKRQRGFLSGFELQDKIAVIIGLGDVGIETANLLSAAGMRVRGFEPMPDKKKMARISRNVEVLASNVALASIVRGADVVSVHVPLLDSTRGLVNLSELMQMKSGAILVNAARRGICHEEAVKIALERGTLGAYLTDADSVSPEILSHPRTLCTPHLGAGTDESEERCGERAARQLKEFLEFGVIRNSVNFPDMEAMPASSTRVRLTAATRDVPGMINALTAPLARRGINIGSYGNDSRGGIAYNVIDVSSDVPPAALQELASLENVLKIRALTL